MNLIEASSTIRVARPSKSLATAAAFWCEGVGLEVLWQSTPDAPGDHALLMLGRPGASWHLELVEDPLALAANPPGPEDLLVVYRGRPVNDAELACLVAAGGTHVPSRNPYWDEHGVTIEDPDGYRLVLTQRTWG